MVDVEAVIVDELAALAPFDRTATADWDDVLARAGTGGAATIGFAAAGLSGRRRRFLLIAVPVAAVLAVLIATPAFGVRSFILDVIGGRTTVPFTSAHQAPTVVRRRFADLGLGAPPGLAPQAIYSQARTVTRIRVRGKLRAIWVAPTRSGGFCWEIEGLEGGCQESLAKLRADFAKRPPIPGAFHPELLGVSWIGASPTSAVPAFITAVIRSRKAERVTASFRDGRSFDLPFVFVSAPINAGFVEWEVPKAEQTAAARLVAVSVRDAKGHLIARYAPDPRMFAPRPTHTVTVSVRPPKLANPRGFKLPPAKPPLERGSGDGVAVTIGSNGVAVFDTSGLSAERRAATRSYSPGCFKLEHDAAGLWVRGVGAESRGFGTTIEMRIFGLKPPFDGCEIGGDYGHRWPDRFGSHSVVEIPLTKDGAAFFTDRAAARDLAAFVRQGTIQKLRRQDAKAIRAGLARYAPRVSEINSASAAPSAGRIGYLVSSSGVTFVEASPTGKRFEVVVENGRITHQNLKPYAFVF